MKKHLSIILCLLLSGIVIHAQEKKPLDYVNTFIGAGDGGNCYPGAQFPFGMISISPNTVYHDYESAYTRAGYKYADTEIYGFGLNHYSGVGCHAMQDLQFLPVSGNLDVSPVNRKGAYKSTFLHDREFASPGFYSVDLIDYGIGTKFTTDIRSAIGEITFGKNDSSHIIFQPTNSSNGIGDGVLTIDTLNNRVTGWISTGGFCWRDPKDRPYKVYFVAEFDAPISDFGIWKGQEKKEKQKTISGDDIGAYISFNMSQNKTVKMKTAISYVSIYNALLNLESEINDWSFDRIHSKVRNEWTKRLDKITVSGGTEDDRYIFYTALYHNMLQANIFNDINGEYIGFDDKIHAIEKGRNKYANFSLWDAYRTTAHLQAILDPEVASDIVNSLLLDAQQGGTFPNWSMNNVEYGVMNGYSPFPYIANMYAFGAKNFDLEAVKNKMKEVSVKHVQLKGHHGWYNVDDYMKFGYVPVDKHGYGTSTTQEYGIDDYSIAKICEAAGDIDAYKYYLNRSQNVFNLFNPETGFIQARNSDGEFIMPFNERSQIGFNEGNAAQYFWSVPHSISKLIKLAGGKKAIEDRLDQFSSKILSGWAPEEPYYWLGNEPCFGAVYVYNYLQAPWKAQKTVRDIINYYENNPSGLPGDDDVGAMSALYVFSAIGLYPYLPGEAGLTITGPLFETVQIKLNNGKSIFINGKGASKDNPYIQNLKLDGKTYTSLWIEWDKIKDGAVLDFSMGKIPNKKWGSAQKDIPPSYAD